MSLLLSQSLLIEQCFHFGQVSHLGRQFYNLQYEENLFTFCYSDKNS